MILNCERLKSFPKNKEQMFPLAAHILKQYDTEISMASVHILEAFHILKLDVVAHPSVRVIK